MSFSRARIPIVYRYIVGEILSPFALCIFVFTGVLFLARSLKLVDLVVNKNVPVSDMILLFSYIVPSFLELAIPMSLLLAVIVSFGRLSADSELVVFRSVGLSLTQLAKPVLGVSLLAFCATLLIGFYVRPWANFQLGEGLFEIAKQQTSSALIQGAFNELGHLTVYAQKVKENGASLTNVIIGDERDPENQRVFLAKFGKIISDSSDRTIHLQLYDGSIEEGEGANLNVTNFEVNSILLPQSELLESSGSRDEKRRKEMMIGELHTAVQKARSKPIVTEEDERHLLKLEIEFQKRIALPFSCLAVSFIALSLGIQPSRGGHTWGPALSLGIGVATILLYYLLFALGSALSEKGVVPPAILLWAPNALYFGTGLYLFKRMGSEQWMAVTEAVGDFLITCITRISTNAKKRL